MARYLATSVLALVLGGFWAHAGAATFAMVGGATEVSANVMAVSQKRISPHDVSVENVEAFKAQLRDDVPKGTSKGQVRAYLARLKINYRFVDPNPIKLDDSNHFQGRIDNIGMRKGFQTSLEFWIRLDKTDAVKGIDFSEIYR